MSPAPGKPSPKQAFLADPEQFFQLDWDATARQIETFLVAHVPANAVIGLSGGIDSSLVASLAVQALGAERVHGILMPSQSNVAEDENLGQVVADQLGISSEVIGIQPLVDAFETHVPHARDFALDNLKPRVRMTILYAYANHHSARVLGTGNVPELMTGYFTKYGDGGVDCEPIGGLYKQQVKVLARHMGVPEAIVTRPPSAGLWPGQTDEGELGITYLQIDEILCGWALGCTDSELVGLANLTREDLQLVREKVTTSSHKRKPPPCYLVTDNPVPAELHP